LINHESITGGQGGSGGSGAAGGGAGAGGLGDGIVRYSW
jgi:hypothetical protein